MQIYTDTFYALKTFSIWRTRDGRKERGQKERQDFSDAQNKSTFPQLF